MTLHGPDRRRYRYRLILQNGPFKMVVYPLTCCSCEQPLNHPVFAMHPLQIEIYRKMTPEQKLRVSLSLYHSAWELKKAAVQKQHPDWDEKKILQAVRKAFLSAAA